MRKKYRHISPSDRIKIYQLILQGTSLPTIADELKIHRSSVYRELSRNSCQHGYRPDIASQQALLRCKKLPKILKNNYLLDEIIQKLKLGWSPEQIAGRLKKINGKTIISHESIYQFIYSSFGQAKKLFKLLRQARRFRYPRVKRRKRMSANNNKASIHDRDPEINGRKRIGDWEADLMLFKKTKTNLLTLRERKTRFIIAIKNASRKAKTTSNTIIKYMSNNMSKNIRTITTDNDTAFALYRNIEQQLNTKIYFCEPYKSYQKGAIENANRLIRTKLPRSTKIDCFSQLDIDNITHDFNNRPMKCLNYTTPNEAFFGPS